MKALVEYKICTKCQTPQPAENFCRDSGYKDGRRSDCNDCRNRQRRIKDSAHFVQVLPLPPQPPTKLTVSHPGAPPVYFQTVPEQDLPDPERLPAAYLKRCADYWTELVGGDEPRKRIA